MFQAHVLFVRRAKLYYIVSGIITPIGGHPVHRLTEDSPIGVMIPETAKYNFALLTMSTCARNMYRLEINLFKKNLVHQVG